MGKVRLEVSPELAGVLDAEGSDWVILEKEDSEWAAIGDLLTDLASGHSDFRKEVYDPFTGRVGDGVLIVLNGSLLQPADVAEVKLKEGDIVLLLPVFAGG
ncbi:MoaD/ThiS family protein [Thermodesulfobacteriota bacterium]